MKYTWLLLSILPIVINALRSQDGGQKPIVSDGNQGCDCTGVADLDGDKYLCGNRLLGPKKLPTGFPYISIVSDYDRLGGKRPKDFLTKWYNTTSKRWNYPPSFGYLLDSNKQPIIIKNLTLPEGTFVDRFGNESGNNAPP